MTIKPTTKRAPEAAMSKEDLSKRIAAAKLELNTALLTGEPTTAARAALRTLEAECAAIEQQEADQIAAQQALKQIEADGINRAAQELLAARNARIAAITTRYPIPDTRTTFHA
ncbi:hypothetical protein [Paraburkholderia sp. GAS32]|uniref:hypothetical protein n=1 Tax=Paraburkholderia sp. GAS32 TaxID=3035129 RepID=UPI003D1ADE95